MKSTVTIDLPFSYRAVIIKSKCRNDSEVMVRAIRPVEVQCIDKLHLAFKVGDEKYFWDNNSLWTPYINKSVSSNHMTLNQLRDCTEKRGRTDSESHFPDCNSPFYMFSNSCSVSKGLTHDESKIELKGTLQFRKMLFSEEEVMYEHALKRASNLCIHKDKVYIKTNEPYYQILAYGSAKYLGSAVRNEITVMKSKIHDDDKQHCYNANELDLALASIKKRTGNDVNLFSFHEVEVIIPEAVQISPKFEKGRENVVESVMVDVVFKQDDVEIGVWKTESSIAKSTDLAIEMAKKELNFDCKKSLDIEAYLIDVETGIKTELYRVSIQKEGF